MHPVSSITGRAARSSMTAASSSSSSSSSRPRRLINADCTERKTGDRQLVLGKQSGHDLRRPVQTEDFRVADINGFEGKEISPCQNRNHNPKPFPHPPHPSTSLPTPADPHVLHVHPCMARGFFQDPHLQCQLAVARACARLRARRTASGCPWLPCRDPSSGEAQRAAVVVRRVHLTD